MAEPITKGRNKERAHSVYETLNKYGAELGNVAELLIEAALDAFDVCDCGRELVITAKCPVCDNDE